MQNASVRMWEVSGSIPLLGHVWALRRRPLEFLTSLYGTCDIAVLKLGVRNAYLLVDPLTVRHVLVTNNHEFGKGTLFEKGKVVFGDSILSSEGERHRRQRRLMQPAFQRSQLAGWTGVIREVVEEIIGSWREGQTIAVDQEMFKVSAGSVAKCLFFAHDRADQAAAVTMHAMPILAEGTTKRALTPTELPYRLPLPANRRYNTALSRLHEVIDDIITDYRHSGTYQGDLLSMLLAAKDDDADEGMTDAQVHDETCGILAAGTETTARALAWTFHVLGAFPEFAEKVRAELTNVLGGRELRHEDIGQLDYLPRLVKEVLRYYSPAFLFTRSPHTDVKIGEHRLPAGSVVLYSPYLLHHDPAVFSNPEIFDPDRWSHEQPNSAVRYSYIPFGAGPHQCIGASFATAEIIIAVATITRRWHLHPTSYRPVRPRAFVTCAPGYLPMTVQHAQ